MDTRGYIRVNERLQTSASDVWAIGECAGSPQFTHVSVDDFQSRQGEHGRGSRSTNDRLVPSVMFTDPPLARVGLSEGEAQRKGIAVRVASLPMSKVLRTEATDETQGFMKVVVGAKDDRILGFTMIGSEAGEVMATVQTAMLARASLFEAPRRRYHALDGSEELDRSCRMCPRHLKRPVPSSGFRHSRPVCHRHEPEGEG